jgi:hypothetical protein
MAQTKRKKTVARQPVSTKSRFDIDKVIKTVTVFLLATFFLASFAYNLTGKVQQLEFNWLLGLCIIFSLPAVGISVVLPSFPEKERPFRRKFALSCWFAFISSAILYYVLYGR